MFLTPSHEDKLRQHAVFLDDGVLKKALGVDRDLQIENMLDGELPRFIAKRAAEGRTGPAPVMLWAHGGNVMRSCAIREALNHIDTWMDNGIYPIYFFWDTGPAATMADAIKEIVNPDAADLDKTVHAHEFFYQTPWDRGFDWLADRAKVPDLWEEMKQTAEASNRQPEGGAYKFIDALYERAGTPKKNISLHAVGHSAGAIFHSWFIPSLLDKDFELETLQLLAPAIRIDRYKEFLGTLLAKDKSIGKTLMFTMTETAERADRLIGLYDQGSLLYFIRDDLDTTDPAALLGLQEGFQEASTDIQDSLRAIYTPTTVNAKDGEQSSAATHVAFSSDGATLNSIAFNILGEKPKRPFPLSKPAKPTVIDRQATVAEEETAQLPS
ncbi:hypothetical protein [Arthrobacter bambusae]|uniref:hypothetical protein n=1 Tax=Arthrobacter bambusae TaxID=1338426 RepID=UPI002780C764|nr:hypothetical protein [Arthrobacter bambusae]MDQ0212570.1 hypothetical protein [Arthrobacter bambusae]MDQ0236952.1 hypothetical protein [Arthrobacter bambusae]